MKQFERACKQNKDLLDSKQTNNHQDQNFDPETLAALHQQHHHNHTHYVQQQLQDSHQFSKTNQIHEAAIHSKPLNYNGI